VAVMTNERALHFERSTNTTARRPAMNELKQMW